MIKRESKFRRYHYKVYFPPNTAEMCLDFFHQIKDVNLTYHAAHQMFDDPKGIICVPNRNDLIDPRNVLVEFYEHLNEIGTRTGTIQKVVLRVKHLSSNTDFTYLLAREGYIVSAWATVKSDVHRLTKTFHQYYCPTKLKDNIYIKLKQAEKRFNYNFQSHKLGD